MYTGMVMMLIAIFLPLCCYLDMKHIEREDARVRNNK